MTITAEDRTVLNLIQSDFPLTSRPYRTIAEKVGLTEKAVIQILKRLKKEGIIRRIGGNFVPEKLGYVSTLCAAKVPAERVEAFSEAVNSYPGVTHNYQRDNEFNIWFTFIERSMERIQQRSRDVESGVTLEYLAALYREYESFIENISRTVPTVRVDWDQFRDAEEMADAIVRVYFHDSFLRQVTWDPLKS